VGREDDVARVTELLASRRLVTLTGAGGVGKTRIACHVGSALLGAYEDGVWLVEFAALRDPALIVETIAAAIGTGRPGEEPALDHLISCVQRRRLLLILDNCEHLVAAVADVIDALQRSCERVRFLVTSREKLNISGEWTYRVPSMSVPETGTDLNPDDLLQFEAVQLFVERARAASHDFVLSGRTAPLVASICRRLDGIPLAIELAAGRIDTLGLADVAQLLDQRFRLLTAGGRTSLERHQTMRASIEWSCDLLSRHERLLLERAAFFPGSWSADAAGVVCRFGELESADVVNLLTLLVDKSLVVMEPQSNRARYRLLESTRAYALERLKESADEPLLQRRLAYWIAEFADRSRKELYTVPRARWLPPMRDELDNARSALEWAIDREGDGSIAARILLGYSPYWADRGHYSEGLRWVSRLHRLIGSTTTIAEEAAFWQCKSTLTWGRHSAEAAREAISRYERLGDLEELAWAYMRQAIGFREMAKFEEAQHTVERALSAYRQAGLAKSFPYANALSWRASALVGLGRRDEARAVFAECIALDEALGDGERAALERLNYAELEFADGNVVEALALTEASLGALRGRHATAAVAAHLNAAAYRIVLGEYTPAQQAANEGLLLARRIGLRVWKAIGVQHVATLAALGGDPERAALLLGYSEACYDAEGSARDLTEQRTLDVLLAALRDRLAEDERARLEASGRALSDEEAFALAVPSTSAVRDVSG
jgi:predicted ATPase